MEILISSIAYGKLARMVAESPPTDGHPFRLLPGVEGGPKPYSHCTSFSANCLQNSVMKNTTRHLPDICVVTQKNSKKQHRRKSYDFARHTLSGICVAKSSRLLLFMHLTASPQGTLSMSTPGGINSTSIFGPCTCTVPHGKSSGMHRLYSQVLGKSPSPPHTLREKFS